MRFTRGINRSGFNAFGVLRQIVCTSARDGFHDLSVQPAAYLMLVGYKILLQCNSALFETRAKGFIMRPATRKKLGICHV